MSDNTETPVSTEPSAKPGINGYMKYLLFIAGMGGLLYGIDVGVIAGALPYLEATTNYTPMQISSIVAAVLLGSVLSSLFAGALSDLFGRKWIMIVSGICFVLSVPVICIGQSYELLFFGRILQGAAAGLIGVVVPLYLAECLTADRRGSGTGMFQFMLTIGLVFAALVGVYFSKHVEGIMAQADVTPAAIFNAKDFAWKAIFWACAVPGIVFTVGALFVSESPRWLFSRKKVEAAKAALLRARGNEADAQAELDEMSKEPKADANAPAANEVAKDSLFSRKYVIPFVIAVVILACNQATGINSVLAYIVNILNQAGLPGSLANEGDLAIKILNCLMTIVAVILVDRKGRKFLLTVGTSGIIIALLGVAGMFYMAERNMEDVTPKFKELINAPVAFTKVKSEADFDKKGEKIYRVVEFQGTSSGPQITRFNKVFDNLASEKAPVSPDSAVKLDLGVVVDSALVDALKPGSSKEAMQVKIVYGYGDFEGMKTVVLRPGETIKGLVNKDYTVSTDKNGFMSANDDSIIGQIFRTVHLNPFANPATIKDAQFELKRVEIGPVPSATHGWIVTAFFCVFIAAFAVGPGVCVWLALSELMPTRIRANGMSIALLVNQFVSTAIAGVFLPVVGAYGYSTIFFFCAGCTVIYFITAVFFLPETKGKTLEEIEAYFDKKKK